MNSLQQWAVWAKQNAHTARIFLVAAHLLLYTIALHFGWYLFVVGIEIPLYLTLGLLSIYTVAAVLYPGVFFNRKKSNWDTFKRRKTYDIILFSTAFLLGVSLANYSPNFLPSNRISQVEAKPMLTAVKIKKGEEQKVKRQIFIQNAEKWLENKLAKIDKYQSDAPKLEFVLLIILFSVLAIFLAVGVLYLSCNLACSGAEAVAFLLLILGIGLAIALLVLGIRGAKRRYERQKYGTT
ncbi:MAG: hypothetical protein MK226_00480 [Saprospiraceae bacterium]|nr:hypothetical protein [Saprospiraceae bacterium]